MGVENSLNNPHGKVHESRHNEQGRVSGPSYLGDLMPRGPFPKYGQAVRQTGYSRCE